MEKIKITSLYFDDDRESVGTDVFTGDKVGTLYVVHDNGYSEETCVYNIEDDTTIESSLESLTEIVFRAWVEKNRSKLERLITKASRSDIDELGITGAVHIGSESA